MGMLRKRNAADAENFAWDEFFGAERKLDLKDRMRASVKEVQKLSADAKKAVGSAGGPSYGAATKRSRPSKRGARVGSAAGGDRSSPPALLSRLRMSLENSSGIEGYSVF
jgi:hypothetical protein